MREAEHHSLSGNPQLPVEIKSFGIKKFEKYFTIPIQIQMGRFRFKGPISFET